MALRASSNGLTAAISSGRVSITSAARTAKTLNLPRPMTRPKFLRRPRIWIRRRRGLSWRRSQYFKHVSAGASGNHSHVQLANTFDSMTVEQNVLIGAEDHRHRNLLQAAIHLGAYRTNLLKARRRALETMELVGIGHLAQTPAARLTFGQQRLTSVARGLAGDVKLLLLDEPAAGLSGGEVEHLCGAILRAQARGTTVLII
jgi:ABC-type branched-subunit amino acid transport system ATPase component